MKGRTFRVELGFMLIARIVKGRRTLLIVFGPISFRLVSRKRTNSPEHPAGKLLRDLVIQYVLADRAQVRPHTSRAHAVATSTALMSFPFWRSQSLHDVARLACKRARRACTRAAAS